MHILNNKDCNQYTLAKMTDLPYTWKQTLNDVDISVALPSGTRAKALNVNIKKNYVSVAIGKNEPIIEVHG